MTENAASIQPLIVILKNITVYGLNESDVEEWLKYQIEDKSVGKNPFEVLDYIQINNRQLTRWIDKVVMTYKTSLLQGKLVDEKIEWYSAVEVYERLGVSKAAFSGWVKKGYFPNFNKINPKKILISKADLDKFFEQFPKYKRSWEAKYRK